MMIPLLGVYNILQKASEENHINKLKSSCYTQRRDVRMKENRPMSKSRTIQTKLVLPPDTNHLQTIFGGQVLAVYR